MGVGLSDSTVEMDRELEEMGRSGCGGVVAVGVDRCRCCECLSL